MRSKKIIAHRGGAEIGNENSLSCFELGIATGADMVEIDINMTKDGHLVVIHDTTVDRTTNGKGIIQEMTLAEIKELRIVDANGNATDELVPTLDEVMEFARGRTQLLIEVKQSKQGYKGIEKALLDTIKRFDAFSWIVAQSFDDSIMERLYAFNTALRLEKLFVFKLVGLPLIFDGRMTTFSFRKYHYVASFNMHFSAATPKLIKEIHQQGKEVKIWTVLGPEDTPTLEVDGIITDRPDLWR
jgi:glycerophosphoryl diester phosphodiesterase